MDSNAKDLCARGEKLFSRRGNLLSFWQECAMQFYPERADFTTQTLWGDEFGSHLFDGAPVRNRRDLGNAFSSMLRPRGQPWFKVTIGDEEAMEDPIVARFCDAATNTMRRLMYDARAQFVRATKEGDHDYATFGNCVLSAEVNRNNDGLLYRNWHLRDCAWAENADGMVDTLFREMKMSARQMRQMFGEEKLHRNVKRALEKDPDTEFTVWHVMLPSEDFEYKRAGNVKRLPWASVYIDKDHREILREAGSHEFRYIVPRWQTVSGSPYAVSPATTVSIADARGLQTMAMVLLEAGEKALDPPMKAAADAVVGDVNLYAGGITWVDKDYDERLGPALEAIQLGKNPGIGADLLARSLMSLKDAWFLNRLTLPAQAKTAFETAQLVEEYVRANIPLFEPMETTYNAPLLDVTATILIRQGAFGRPEEIPEQLAGRDIEFAFSNPLQDAIERNKVNQATTIFGLAAAAKQTDPTAVEQVDFGAMLRDATRGSGAPAKWLKDEARGAQDQNAVGQAGDVLAALQGAGQAAGVVQQGANAAAAVQGLLPAPGAGVPA